MAHARKFAIALLIALCLSVSLNIALHLRIAEYAVWLQDLHEKVNELSLENLMLKENLEVLKRDLEYYPTDASLTGDNWIYMAGVITSSSGSYEGEILRVYARFVKGTGKVFIATSPKIGIEPVSYTHLTLPTNREV